MEMKPYEEAPLHKQRKAHDKRVISTRTMRM